VEKILVKAKLIANFKENFENVNKKYNKKDFYKVDFVEIKENIYYIYRKNVLFINK